MNLFHNGVIITYPTDMDEQEAKIEAEETIRDYASRGKELTHINIIISGNELQFDCKEKSPITRLRRITGYMSKVENFNAGKQAELKDRVVHS